MAPRAAPRLRRVAAVILGIGLALAPTHADALSVRVGRRIEASDDPRHERTNTPSVTTGPLDDGEVDNGPPTEATIVVQSRSEPTRRDAAAASRAFLVDGRDVLTRRL